MTLDERLKREVGRGYDVENPLDEDVNNTIYNVPLARSLIGRGYEIGDAVSMASYSRLTNGLDYNCDVDLGMARALAAYAIMTLNEEGESNSNFR